MFDPTVARLTYRGLLGRRRVFLLSGLPLLLLVIAVLVRATVGADDAVTANLLTGFGVATMVPLIGVIAGTGAIAPEIEDGSVLYLLAKPLKRPTIIVSKLIVAIGVSVAFTAVPMLLAGFVLNGNSGQLAVAFAVASALASVAYSALFLLLGTVTRHAVVIGLVYALIWEALVGSVVPGARVLSVQQWGLSLAERIAADGTGVSSSVGPVTGVVLLLVVTVLGGWFAGHKLRTLSPQAGEA